MNHILTCIDPTGENKSTPSLYKDMKYRITDIQNGHDRMNDLHTDINAVRYNADGTLGLAYIQVQMIYDKSSKDGVDIDDPIYKIVDIHNQRISEVWYRTDRFVWRK